MSARYVVRPQDGLSDLGKFTRGYGIWDTHKNKWVNKTVFINNTRQRRIVNFICKKKNEDNA